MKKLEGYLSRRKVTLEVGSPELPPRKAGSFTANDDGTATLRLKADSTNQVVWHELGHFIQWRPLGSARYNDLSRSFGTNVPEQFVFDLLERPERWTRLTPGFLEESIRYIDKTWGGFSGR